MTSSANFKQLEIEMAPYKAMMQKAADTIINENVSDYPIMIVHQQEIELGIPLIQANKDNAHWSIHASTLEEFISRQLIQEIKLDSFKTIYKSPETHLCLFVLSELGANFVFLPRQNQN